MAPADLYSIKPRNAGVPSLTVGLVNNMPQAAAEATDRQFHRLLSAAFPAREVRLRRLTCLEVPDHVPSDVGHRERHDALDAGGPLPDALVVTGAEPVARALADEPIWPGIVWVADWAAANGVPVIWSCLAGHAALRHLDGIERVRLPGKLSGLFESRLAGGLGQPASLPTGIAMPQSRYHGVPDRLLDQKGYRVLVQSAATGPDAFTKQAGAEFLFLQGHPEYDADTLMREYRRDMRRYLDGARDAPPGIPHGYFDGATEQALAAMTVRAAGDRSAVAPADFNAILSGASLAAPWHAPAARMIGTWLSSAAGRAFHARTHRRAPRETDTQRGAAA